MDSARRQTGHADGPALPYNDGLPQDATILP